MSEPVKKETNDSDKTNPHKRLKSATSTIEKSIRTRSPQPRKAAETRHSKPHPLRTVFYDYTTSNRPGIVAV